MLRSPGNVACGRSIDINMTYEVPDIKRDLTHCSCKLEIGFEIVSRQLHKNIFAFIDRHAFFYDLDVFDLSLAFVPRDPISCLKVEHE